MYSRFPKLSNNLEMLQLQSTSLMKHCYLCMSIKYLNNSQIASKGLEQGLENIDPDMFSQQPNIAQCFHFFVFFQNRITI